MRALPRLVLVALLAAACNCGEERLQRSDARIAAAPDPLDFGAVYVGLTLERGLVVANGGTGALTITAVRIEGDERHAFALGGALNHVPARGEQKLLVRYTAPAQEGEDRAELVIESDADGTPVLKVALVGVSTATCPGGSTETRCGNTTDDDCDGDTDCDDDDCAADAACAACTPTETAETSCGDGQNNDCDDKTDCDDSDCAGAAACQATCPPDPAQVRLTNDSVPSGAPMVAWNGSEFGVLFNDYDTPAGGQRLRFVRVSAGGMPVSAAVETGIATAAGPTSFLWNGSEYAVAWSDVRVPLGNRANDSYFARLGTTGSIIGAEVNVDSMDYAAYPVETAWNNVANEYAVVWAQVRSSGQIGGGGIHFQRIGANGALLGARVNPVPEGTSSDQVSIAWNGSRYALAWYRPDGDTSGTGTVRFLLLDRNGARASEEIQLGAKPGYGTRIVWTGTEFAVVWAEQGDLLRFARVSPQGQLAAATVSIADSTGGFVPFLAWDGSGYGLTWAVQSGSQRQVYFARINADGSLRGSARRVGCAVSSGFSPSLAWTGTQFGLAWGDSRNGQGDIYFQLMQ